MQGIPLLRPVFRHAILSGHQRQRCHPQKQSMFHHAHDPANLRRQHLGLLNHTASAIQNVVLFIRQIGPVAALRLPAAPDSTPEQLSLGSTTGNAIFTTSTGRGNLPSRSTSFVESTTTRNSFAALATIFSRSSAPPPPLIKRKPGPNFIGAIDIQIQLRQLIQRRHIHPQRQPKLMARIARSHAANLQSLCTRAPSSRINIVAVVPVPSPTAIPSSTNSTARFATSRFASSCVIRASPLEGF